MASCDHENVQYVNPNTDLFGLGVNQDLDLMRMATLATLAHRETQSHRLSSIKPPKNATNRKVFPFVGGHPPNNAAKRFCFSSADEGLLVTPHIAYDYDRQKHKWCPFTSAHSLSPCQLASSLYICRNGGERRSYRAKEVSKLSRYRLFKDFRRRLR
jgi:hypothetical protein